MVFGNDYSSQKKGATNKCSSVKGHFNGHADALKCIGTQCLMQHVVFKFTG